MLLPWLTILPQRRGAFHRGLVRWIPHPQNFLIFTLLFSGLSDTGSAINPILCNFLWSHKKTLNSFFFYVWLTIHIWPSCLSPASLHPATRCHRIFPPLTHTCSNFPHHPSQDSCQPVPPATWQIVEHASLFPVFFLPYLPINMVIVRSTV